MKKCLLFLLLGLTATFSQGQQSGYSQTNLVADTAGIAAHTDSQLSNPWGIAVLPGQPIWIANNNGGTSTLYDAAGNKNSLVVQIPTASVNPCSVGCPTGIVASSFGADFGGAQFIFDTEDGILVSWSAGVVGVKVVDNSAAGAVYKGFALLSNGAGNFLLAANFRSGKVEVFDRTFSLVSLSGSFTDPGLPAGFAPHGIHIINNQVLIAYALQDGPKHDPVIGAGNGVVDIFDMNGNFVKRFASSGALNAPWGVALAPASFGQFSNAILVGNFGDGIINAFDSNGNMMGQLSDTSGHVLSNAGLWDMLFGQTQTFGDPQTLYITAGGADQTHGLFATLRAAQAVSSGDFSLSLSSTSASVVRGGVTTINISANAVGGFDSAITLSCSGLPAGVNCGFSPDVITPGTSTTTSVLTLSVSQGYNPMAMWLPFSGIGLFGLAFATPEGDTKSRKRLLKRAAIAGAVVLVAVLLLMAAGCGMNSGNHMNSTGGSSFLITGTSGSVMHSVQVSLMVQ